MNKCKYKDLFCKQLNENLDELLENQKQVFIQNGMEDKSLQQIATEQCENKI